MQQHHGTMFTKLDLIERIITTTDEKVLAKVGELLANEQGEFAFTKGHLALLEERRRQGKGKGYSLGEVKTIGPRHNATTAASSTHRHTSG
jgi:hypothetical protein